MTIQSLPETGPLLAGSEGAVRSAAPDQSDTQGGMTPEVAERANRLRRQFGGESAHRTALLGVLLARLQSVPFDGVATLLNLKEARLAKFMHGEELVPRSFEDRWLTLSNILEDVQAVLRPEATWRWMNTSIPDLADKSPYECIRKGKLAEVAVVAKSYRDPAFH